MTDQQDHIKSEEETLLKSISFGKLMIPVVLGVGAVLYMITAQFDLTEIKKLHWSINTVWWLVVAVGIYVIRHLCYAWRLRYASNNFFSLKQAIRLIVIWEFSSAASPTAVGGAGVAFYLLSQEKFGMAKTMAVVIYTMVLDTLFLLIASPLFIIIFGAFIVKPGVENIFTDPTGFLYILVWFFMFAYGFLFFYGLFINPNSISKLLHGMGRLPLLKRWQPGFHKTAQEIIIAADEMKHKDFKFHIRNFSYTAGAWILKFLGLNAVLLALVPDSCSTVYDQLVILGRGMCMHIITAFSPTPGGAGIVEIFFGRFFTDYIPESTASLVALIWRLITYYPYLLLGAVIIPIWLRDVIRSRKSGH
jgi:glycosyltransferase 2 family protein